MRLFLNFDDFSIRRVPLDAVDAIEAAGLLLVAFAYGNDFAVSGFQAETVLPCLVQIHFILVGIDRGDPHGLQSGAAPE